MCIQIYTYRCIWCPNLKKTRNPINCGKYNKHEENDIPLNYICPNHAEDDGLENKPNNTKPKPKPKTSQHPPKKQ